MVFYTQHDFEKQLCLYGDKFNLALNGKKIGECIDIIRDVCPKLHSDSELKELALSNLHAIEKEYGFKALRLYMYDTSKGALLQSFTGKDLLQLKYEKLLKDVGDFHDSLRDNELYLTLDVYLYYKYLEEVFNEEYGVLKDFNNQLYSIMKTIDISNYDNEVIKSLKPYLQNVLTFSNGKYYLKKDLENPSVLKMLYEHIGELNFDEILVKDYNILTDYDGYGNEYYIDDYSESWEDEKGYHYRSWAKESTIADYDKIGLP